MSDTVIRQGRGGSFAVNAEDDRIAREQRYAVDDDSLTCGEFVKLMGAIRAAYATALKTMPDSAAFESLVEEPGVYEKNRWPLRRVTQALVRTSSAKAKAINARCFGGKFR